MTLEEMKAHFREYKLMTRALDVSYAGYLLWRKRGYVPYPVQVKTEIITKGALKARWEDDPALFEGVEHEAKRYLRTLKERRD